MLKECKFCGKEFETKTVAKFCSQECKLKNTKNFYKKRYEKFVQMQNDAIYFNSQGYKFRFRALGR